MMIAAKSGFLACLLALFVLTSTSALTISDIHVSNYSSASVTVSWITDAITNGTLNYGTSIALGSTASDARADDDTHWVQLTELSPETTYYYEVVSGGTTDNNSGSYYSFTTTKTGTGLTYTVFGFVHQRDGNTPAEGSIVYLTVTHDGETSYRLSTLTDSTGAWNLNLGNLKSPATNNTLAYATGDTISLSVQGAADGAGSSAHAVSGSSPQQLSPDVSLPVTLVAFAATSSADGVKLDWVTATQVDHVGWHIYRAERKEGSYTRITRKIISGAGNVAMPVSYSYLDKDASPGHTYFYYLEDIDLAGGRNRSQVIRVTFSLSSGAVHPDGKLPITWGRLRQR